MGIKNIKQIKNYDNLSLKRKLRFWIRLPLMYFKKLYIMNKYKKYM